ncbi:MAG: FAD-binding protein [Phenylobacterium sp.]|uniref:FAD-dependent oxidoreductase n=1 Tax=Phenylobacterium sp. TaxID=1871053 RepID=UPI002734B939|nr:FAD-binding protein [Phenylobacterium sp.]MDP3172879.1 FAD-binding protein [Phenylobacterium sp.]
MPAQHALVIGGGIAGMCAARALTDTYARVTLVERDQYPNGVGDRRGVPQSRMFHTLIERGRREVESLFPGFHARLDQARMPRMSYGFNVALMSPRGWSPPSRSPVVRGLFVTRTLLETTIRDHLRETANVTIIEAAAATRLLAETQEGRKVCRGAEIRRRDTGEVFTIEADLVVDASGASSKSADWFADLGLAAPEEETLDPLLTYGGQWMKLREGARWPTGWWWTHGVFIQRVPPHDLNGAHLMRQEGDLWLLTLVAGAGQEPPMDPDGVAKFLAGLRSPLISEMLPLFEPVSKMTGYRLSKNRWRHYERWADSLDGFIAMGDATCVFNPNQGQGMSVAASEAGILRRCLAQTTSPRELPALFFAKQAKFKANPWRLAISNDLRFASVEGERTAAVGVFNWWRVQLGLSPDRAVQQRLAEVDLLLRPVKDLFDLRIAARMVYSRTVAALRPPSERAPSFGSHPPSLPTIFT